MNPINAIYLTMEEAEFLLKILECTPGNNDEDDFLLEGLVEKAAYVVQRYRK